MENKFKVGDKIIGNENAKPYAITCPGWKGVVVKTYSGYFSAKTIIANSDLSALDYEAWEALSYEAFDLFTNSHKSPEIEKEIVALVNLIQNG